MTGLVLTVVLCFSLASLADQQKPIDPSRELQNLVYYPHANEVSFTSSYQSSLNEVGPTINAAGNESRATSTLYNEIPVTLTYGVVDRIRLSISQTYLLQQSLTDTSTASGNVTVLNASGPSSPTYSVIWRAMQDQQYFLDLNFSTTPQNGTRLAETADQSGNNLVAMSTSSLTAIFYFYFGDEEVEIEPAAQYHSTGMTQGSVSTSNTIYPTQFVSGSLTLAERSHVGKKFYVEPILLVTLPYDYTYVTQSTGALATVSLNMTLNPELQIGYLPTRWCLLTFGVAFTSTNYNTNQAPSTASLTIDYDSSTSFGARFIF